MIEKEKISKIKIEPLLLGSKLYRIIDSSTGYTLYLNMSKEKNRKGLCTHPNLIIPNLKNSEDPSEITFGEEISIQGFSKDINDYPYPLNMLREGLNVFTNDANLKSKELKNTATYILNLLDSEDSINQV
jgi:hypothetical protein